MSTWDRYTLEVDSDIYDSPAMASLSDKAFRLYVSLWALRARYADEALDLDVDYSYIRAVARGVGAGLRHIEELEVEQLIHMAGGDPRHYVLKSGSGGSCQPIIKLRLRPQGRAAIPTRIRDQVFSRDGGACLLCQSTESLSLDHVIPWSHGGSDSVDNLRLLCRSCNSRRGAARFDDETLRNGAQSG